MHRILINSLKNAWSATSFTTKEIDSYARRMTTEEVRNGLMGLSVILLCLFGVESYLFSHSDLGVGAVHTCLMLALLAVHILVSARAIRDIRSLYLLGTTLLIISGTAFVLLAHNSGSFNFTLFASVTLLFMVVPIVPWGLKEALLVLALIYITFTTSTWAASRHFDTQTLWSLQFIMLGAGAISLVLVMRNTCLRKADICTRFELEQANQRMMHLSNKDPLTGAWNRRFLKQVFNEKTAEWLATGQTWHFAFMDLDDFKLMNDTCGHEFGDLVLRDISNSFSELVRDKGYVIRMGGDEFALLFTSDNTEALLAEGVECVRAAVRLPKHCCTLRINMSFGIVSVPAGVRLSQEVVYRAADAALYQAKGRKQFSDGEANIVRTIAETPA
jgi:diguanylate cyclase (GGDEF)-like protein